MCRDIYMYMCICAHTGLESGPCGIRLSSRRSVTRRSGEGTRRLAGSPRPKSRERPPPPQVIPGTSRLSLYGRCEDLGFTHMTLW